MFKNDNVGNLAEVAEKVPRNWRKSDFIPIYKGRGNFESCESCSGVGLLEHGKKVIEKMFEKRLGDVVGVDEVQMGLCLKRVTIDAILILRQALECKMAEGDVRDVC